MCVFFILKYGVYPYYIYFFLLNDILMTNTYIMQHQVGMSTIETDSFMYVLSQIAHEAAFDQLRTKEQLGLLACYNEPLLLPCVGLGYSKQLI